MRLFLIYIMMIAYGCSAATSKTLTFPEALQLAYQHNPELRVAMADIERLKGAVIQSGLLPNPAVSLEAENIGGSGQYQGYESAETTLSVTQPIPLGHRLRYLQSAAYANYGVGIARLQVKKMDIYTRVGLAYVDALYAGQWYAVTQKLTRLHQRIVSEIKRRNVAGAGTELDLRLAELRLYEARIRQNRAGREQRLAEAVLARVMGVEMKGHRQLTDKGLSHQTVQWHRLVEKMPQSPALKEKHCYSMPGVPRLPRRKRTYGLIWWCSWAAAIFRMTATMRLWFPPVRNYRYLTGTREMLPQPRLSTLRFCRK